MLFCEECNILTEEKRCPLCRNKKLRPIKDDDFCYFDTINSLAFKMFESALHDKNIDVVAVPYYSWGVSHANAGHADKQKVYIRYKDFEVAKEIYNTVFLNN